MRRYEICEVAPQGPTDPNVAAADPWFPVQQQTLAPSMNRGHFAGGRLSKTWPAKTWRLVWIWRLCFSALMDRSKTVASTDSTNIAPGFKLTTTTYGCYDKIEGIEV